MKLYLLSSDAGGDRNPILEQGIFRHLPLTASMREADAVAVPICFVNDYRFNEELLKFNKPLVLFDFMEFGWQAGGAENIFGQNITPAFGHINTPEWLKLDQWVATLKNPLLFKRELFTRDVTDFRIPIEFPCVHEISSIQSKDEFESRPIEVFFNWGYSHPIRQRMHGRVFSSAVHLNAHIVDGWTQRIEGNAWVTIHTPHYERKSIREVLEWQGRSKVSISLPGAGVKCFRSAEAPVNSVMALLHDELAWSYPWIDGDNCIRLDSNCHITRMAEIIRNGNGSLYEMYRRSQETIRKYEQHAYARDYIIPSIESRL